MKVSLNKDNVKLIGRTKVTGENLLLAMSGTGIEFEYEGEGFDMTFIAGEKADIPDNDAEQARIAVYVDGVRRVDTQLRARETTVHILKGDPAGRPSADASLGVRRDPPGDISTDPTRGVRRDPYLSQWCKNDGKTHVVRVIKLSEAAMSVAMIAPFEISEGESVRPTPKLPHRIEFIGDSITCGYGVDDEDPLHPFKTATEDVTRAYAYKTAASLGVEYSMFAASGWGIVSGWTDDPGIRHAEQLIPDYYETLGLTYDSIPGVPATGKTPWDFDEYVPEVIVINLGTNDDSYTVEDESRQNEYASLYVDFLEKVRSHNKDAYIICVLGVMGDRLYPYVRKAVEDYKAKTGDEQISAVHLPEQDGNIGYVCDYHPLESAHDKASEVLVAAIRKIMGW